MDGTIRIEGEGEVVIKVECESEGEDVVGGKDEVAASVSNQDGMKVRKKPKRKGTGIKNRREQCRYNGCGKRITRSRRKQHLRLCHNVGVTNMFLCPHPDCGREFKEKWMVGQHERSVHEGRECKKCGEMVEGRMMKEHLKSAHGVQMVGCLEEGCGKEFTTRGAMMKHMMSFHGKTVEKKRTGRPMMVKKEEGVEARRNYKGMTQEQLDEHNRKQRERRQKMTPEEYAEYKRIRNEKDKLRRLTMTKEEKEEWLRKMRERNKKWRIKAGKQKPDEQKREEMKVEQVKIEEIPVKKERRGKKREKKKDDRIRLTSEEREVWLREREANKRQPLSEEEKKERRRAKGIIDRLNKKAAMTEEERRMYNLKKYLSRMALEASLTKEELRKKREYQAWRNKQWRNSLTGEKKRRHLESCRRALKKCYQSGSERARIRYEKQREAQKERERRKTQNETPEQRERRLLRYKVYQSKRKLREKLEREGVLSKEEIEQKLEELEKEIRSQPMKTTGKPFEKRTGYRPGRPRKVTPPPQEEGEAQISMPSLTVAPFPPPVIPVVQHEDLHIQKEPPTDFIQHSDTSLDAHVTPVAVVVPLESFKANDYDNSSLDMALPSPISGAEDDYEEIFSKEDTIPYLDNPNTPAKPPVDNKTKQHIKSQPEDVEEPPTELSQPDDFPNSPWKSEREERVHIVESTRRKVNIRKQVNCPECGKLIDRCSLKKHLRNIHGIGPQQVFPCPECGKEFKDKDYMTDHLRSIHYQIDGRAKYKKNERRKLMRRMEQEESDGRDVMCEECGGVYSSRYIEKHKKLRHGVGREGEEMECEHCGKKLVNKKQLLAHITKMHIERDPEARPKSENTLNVEVEPSQNEKGEWVCPECGLGFEARSFFNRHYYYKHGEGAVPDNFCQCQECGKRFKQKSTLDDHIRRTHRGLDFRCDICRRDLQSAGRLWKHKVDVHGMSALQPPPEVEVIECEHCGEKILRGFNAHMKKNHPEVKFTPIVKSAKKACPECGKMVFANHFRKHLRNVHEIGGTRSFECRQCGSEFKEKYHLDHHVKQVHLSLKKIVRQKFVIERGTSWPRTYFCRVCNEKVNSLSETQVHIFKSHPKVFERVKKEGEECPVLRRCPICPMVGTKEEELFEGEDGLKEHFEKEHPGRVGEFQMSMDVCGSEYVVGGGGVGVVRRGKKTEAEWRKTYAQIMASCPICTKEMKLCFLGKHIQCYHEVKEDDWRCDHCGKQFGHRIHWMYHMDQFHQVGGDKLLEMVVKVNVKDITTVNVKRSEKYVPPSDPKPTNGRRGRGRPRKTDQAVTAKKRSRSMTQSSEESDEEQEDIPKPRKRRGRPRKRRGRPRKTTADSIPSGVTLKPLQIRVVRLTQAEIDSFKRAPVDSDPFVVKTEVDLEYFENTC